MTLLTIVQNALNEIGNIGTPTGVFGNPDPLAIQSLTLANRALKEVAKVTGWQPLSREHAFTTVDGQDTYDLPSDFKAIVNQTMWNLTNRRRVQGAITPVEWARLNAIQSIDSIAMFYRIFRSPDGNGQQIQFFPTPSADQDITFEYISNSLTQSASGDLQGDAFLADDDTALLNEDLITLCFKWRYLASKGAPYAEAFRDYEMTVNYEAASTGSGIIDMGSDGLSTQRVLLVPDGGFGS